MDFDLDDDDRAIQEGMRSFCQGRFPIDLVRAGELTDSVIDRGRWRELAEMGVFTLGPDGLDRRHAVLVFEQLGRSLVPGPLVDTALAGSVLAAAADGELVVVCAEHTEPVTLIEHPVQLDALLMFDDEGVRVALQPDLDLVAVERPLDALTPVAVHRGALPAGDLVGDRALAGRLSVDGLLLTAAQQVGVARAATDLATEYAKQREQFGRAIGSFQAVKHLLAEMLTTAEVALVAVHAAACAADGVGDDDPRHAAMAAKLLAGDAALFCAKTGIQVHGGMGFTWEVDAQRYWKRACVLDTHFGNGHLLAEQLAETVA